MKDLGANFILQGPIPSPAAAQKTGFPSCRRPIKEPVQLVLLESLLKKKSRDTNEKNAI
jgi:hypothetical protein